MAMEKPYLVKTIKGPIDWRVEVPGSKSMTNRALLMAALTDGRVELSRVLFSDDSRHFLSCLMALGFEVEIEEEKQHVIVMGQGGEIPKKEAEIYVGSAGTAARFLTAMLGFSDGVYTIQASEQMKRRPMDTLFALLEDAGARITYLEKEGHLPVRIRGCKLRTKAQKEQESGQNRMPIYLALDIEKSTQFLSALLLVSPMVKEGMQLRITGKKKDGAYVRITRAMLEDSGVTVEFDGEEYHTPKNAAYQKHSYWIEPDVSAACYFYAAAAILGGKALVKDVFWENSQGDLKFLRVLEQMGATVTEEKDGIAVVGPSDGRLQGITVNMNDFSDQALTLAAIAPFAAEKVRMEGIAHIRLQECDRVSAMAQELFGLGILCAEEKAAITIYPGIPRGGCVKTYDDHRVAMAFSLIGLRVEGIRIENPSCCKKTFEGYFELLSRLTGKEKE